MRTAVLVALLLTACTKDSPNYCPPGEPGCAPKKCTMSDNDCVCSIPDGICVMCTATDERNCGGTTPHCGIDHACHACRTNADCAASGACLEDGACADATKVVYASLSGSNTPGCGTMKDGPNECSITQALAEVNATRNIIRLAPGTYMVSGTDGLDFSSKSATVIARGATIKQMSNGAIMSARNNGTLKLIGGTLQGANNADGIRCNTGGKLQVHEATIEKMTESGIEADSCELMVSRTTLRDNSDGGIKMINTPKVATITNNFVYRNGSGASAVGGMVLELAPGSQVEFNTLVSNMANTNSGSSGGATCDAQSYNAPHNLIYRNQGGLGGVVQIIGTCTFQGSYAMAAGAIDENTVGFVDPNNPTNPNFHLSVQSPIGTIRDGFDCTGIDFDGDPRPEPAGGKCDFGADEYRSGQ